MALTKAANLKGTQLNGGTSTNLNSAATFTSLKFNTLQDFDATYFDYDVANPTRLVFKTAGKYLISLGLPMTSNMANATGRNDIEMEFRKNGTAVAGGWSDSSYIRNAGGHAESSNRASTYVDVAVDDYVEIFVIRGSTETTNIVTNDGHALTAMYIDDMPIFAGRATESTYSTDLNSDQTTAYKLKFDTEDAKDSGFTHSTVTSSENITLDSAGAYLVFANIPSTSVSSRVVVGGRVLLDGTLVAGGLLRQGQIRGTDEITAASSHYAGIIKTTSANQVLAVDVRQLAYYGVATVGSKYANILVVKLPSETGVYQAEATQLDGATTNWNPASKTAIDWETDNVIDTAAYTHSTTVNQHQITVDAAGDYLVVFNIGFSGAVTRANPKATLQVNSTDVFGFQDKSGYIRNSNGVNESSNVMVGIVTLVADDIITISMEQEAASGTIDDDSPATIGIYQIPSGASPVVVNSISVTRSASYAIKRITELTKSAEYQVGTQTGITKGAVYLVGTTSLITKSAVYVIIFVDTVSITRSATYSLLSTTAITRSAEYIVGDSVYSYEDCATLPPDASDLANYMDVTEIASVIADDASRFSFGTLAYNVQQIRKKKANSTDGIAISWNGQSNIAPSSSAMYLQIYNFTTSLWETVDSYSLTTVDSDFNLTATIASSVADYYNVSNEVVCRVYKEHM